MSEQGVRVAATMLDVAYAAFRAAAVAEVWPLKLSECDPEFVERFRRAIETGIAAVPEVVKVASTPVLLSRQVELPSEEALLASLLSVFGSDEGEVEEGEQRQLHGVYNMRVAARRMREHLAKQGRT